MKAEAYNYFMIRGYSPLITERTLERKNANYTTPREMAQSLLNKFGI